MSIIELLLVEDQTIVREGLRILLEAHPGLRVAAEAETVAGAISAARNIHPDVVLMDLKLGNESGLEATRQILVDNPKARILVLTAYDDFASIEAAAAAGVMGYAPKQIGIGDLIAAIFTVYQGNRYVHPSLAGSMLEGIRNHAIYRSSGRTPLDEEEQHLMRLMADGLSFGEIAARVYASERTVRRHVQSLLDKLGASDRIQAVAMAIRNGWLN